LPFHPPARGQFQGSQIPRGALPRKIFIKNRRRVITKSSPENFP
jgi:hypothetical protein